MQIVMRRLRAKWRRRKGGWSVVAVEAASAKALWQSGPETAGLSSEGTDG